MAKSKWSKEDLESTFEAFLKTSLSSEEDTDKIKQLLEAPVKRKDVNPSALWWANDSDDDSIKKGKGKSFLKTKKSSDSPSRSKTSLDSGKSSSKGKSSVKTSTPNRQVTSPRKSGRSDPQKTKRKTSPGKTRGSKSKIDTSMSKDSLEDISEKSEEHDLHDHHHSKGNTNNMIISINDSSIDTSASYEAIQSNKSKEHLGFDTLDEEADKQRFFQRLENEADGTVDYGRLNQELSQTGGTRADLSALSGPGGDSGTPARQPTLDVTDSSVQKPSMLSRVALMDSMESTLNTTTSPQMPNSRETTQSLKNPALSGHLGTNTSREMEDLQRVLQEAEETPTIYGGDSRPATAKTNNQTTTPVHERKEVDRSVGDILKEMDAIDRRGREIEIRDDDIQLRSNYKSPRSPRSPGLQRQHHLDELGGFDHSHTEDTEVYQPVTAVSVTERRRGERKPDVRDARPSSATSTSERARSSRDRYSHVQSSGYGRPSSPPSRKPRSRSAGKSPPKVQGRKASPGDGSRERTKKMESSPTFNIQKMMGKGSGNDKKLMKSMETFARYLSEHLASSQPGDGGDQMRAEWAKKPGHEREAALLEELKDVREQLNNERTFKAKMQADMVSQEKEFKKQLESQKLKYEDEVFSLKQENFVLAAKLKELEGDKERVKRSDGSTVQGSSEDGETRIARMEREIQEQENLLAGYQAENKRLYEEIKGLQRQAKATESSMFKENQRLTTELSNVKQELELKNTELQNKGIITSVAVQQQLAAGNAEAMMGATRISHLEGELTEAKRVQENQSREIKFMQQNKFELERHIETLVQEKDNLARLLADSLKPDQVKELEAKHKEETDKLQKKIKWYAENQELLDKSNAKLRAKDDEIHRLKLRIEDFQSEAGRKLEENKIRAKEKAASAKRIQDLERQVKEMEQVIRRRHPNSLPAMMMVAATVPDSVTDNSQVKGRSVQVLEARVKKLEKELESKDESSQQDLRGMEQKYNHLKIKYEERVADLENQLSLYRHSAGEPVFKDHPHSHAVALERELDNVRDRCRKQVAEMQAEVDRVTAELNKVRKNQENMMRNESRQTETEWRQQILGLQRELKDRDHDIQMLQHTIEKMRTRSGKKGNSTKPSAESSEWPPFPHAPSASRDYEPKAFADSDMSALLQENQQLKTKLDQLQLELDQQRVDLRRSLAETESVARQNRERLENQIEVLRSSHQKELQRILADQALQSSSSRVAELQSKCDTQEVMIRHLQAQLKKAASEAEQLPQLRAREAELKAQLDSLQEKLREAKMVQAPEMRHFESLEEKLTDLVQRQRKRETELDTVVKQNQLTCRAEMEEEVEKWKRMVDAKNQQLQVFRAELDSILEVLRTLQRQGVTLPVGTLYS